MSALLIGFFAALAGILVGYILYGLYPRPFHKFIRDDFKEEVNDRLNSLERDLLVPELVQRIEALESQSGMLNTTTTKLDRSQN